MSFFLITRNDVIFHKTMKSVTYKMTCRYDKNDKKTLTNKTTCHFINLLKQCHFYDALKQHCFDKKILSKKAKRYVVLHQPKMTCHFESSKTVCRFASTKNDVSFC